MFNQEPIQHTTLLNNEMKNPHLVETTIIAYPATGKIIEQGVSAEMALLNRILDEIPRINVDFMIQGIPILLTTQSYLTLRFNVAWHEANEVRFNPHVSYGYSSSLVAGGVDDGAGASGSGGSGGSGGGGESSTVVPGVGEDLRKARSTRILNNFNVSARMPRAREGGGEDEDEEGVGVQVGIDRTRFPYGITLEDWVGDVPTRLEIDTAIWPKLNSQVIDTARATFSNFGIESRNTFFVNYIRSLQTPPEVRDNDLSTHNDVMITTFPNVSQRKARTVGPTSHVENAIYGISMALDTDVNQYYPDPAVQSFEVRIPLAEILPVFQIPVLPIAQTNTSNIALNLTMFSPATMFPIFMSFRSADGKMSVVNDVLNVGGTFRAYDALKVVGYPDYQQITVDERTFVGVDKILYQMMGSANVINIKDFNTFLTPTITTECWLNLKVLTDPMLNPLVEAYIRPFITPANEFRAMFSDVFTYSQTIMIPHNSRTTFNFAPSQLFYNTTQVGLFFVQDMLEFKEKMDAGLNITKWFANTASAFKSGHFCKKSTLKVSQFQIGLSSSCTPLFSEPLDESGMQLATEDCFRKYRPTNMVGNIVQDRGRMVGGDAFYLFDLTHTEGAGYFIDADNMINVSGTLTNFSAEDAVVQVVLCLFYQNSFTVILELDGAVLIQQS